MGTRNRDHPGALGCSVACGGAGSSQWHALQWPAAPAWAVLAGGVLVLVSFELKRFPSHGSCD